MVDNKDKSTDPEKEKRAEEKGSLSKADSSISLHNQKSTLSSISNQHHDEMIGEYQIIRKIGSGGMSIVYEARQNNPKRLVALKVIRGGQFLDEHHKKLFEREAQALARLNHPGIAAIYETGCTSDGQNFYTMELVRGETLKDYLERTGKDGNLTPGQLGERLAIFRKISDAVTYAHQRGVIHRDLKPSNIIVLREYDPSDTMSEPSSPGIKILDFGLARITEADIAIATFGTEVGMIMGTLPYMSPEQIRGNPDEIDVRSDVYSLGVILYEMIADQKPYDVHQAMIHEAARIICETPPAPISKSWRGTKRLSRDLEIIVLKALEKPTIRRYQSVSELGEDISRFLAGQPINARPPSTAYQLRKLAQRHKIGFGFAISIMVLIVTFSITTTIQSRRIAEERDRANREAVTSNQVSEFLTNLFKVSDPSEARGNSITAREILDNAAQKIDEELSGQAEIQARLMYVMGSVYMRLGLYKEALPFCEKSLDIRRKILGNDAPETLESINRVAGVYLKQGEYARAENYFREAMEGQIRVLGHDNLQTLISIDNYGSSLVYQLKFEEATQYYYEALEGRRRIFGDDNKETLRSVNNVAALLVEQGKLNESEKYYREGIKIGHNILGEDHPYYLTFLGNLGYVLTKQGKLTEAEIYLQKAIAGNRRVQGENHPETLRALFWMCDLLADKDKLAEAEACLRKVLQGRRIVFTKGNPEIAETLIKLGDVLNMQGHYSEAEILAREALQDTTKSNLYITEDSILRVFSESLAGQKKFREAEPILVKRLNTLFENQTTSSEERQKAIEQIIQFYVDWGKLEEVAVWKKKLSSLEYNKPVISPE